MSRNYLDLNKDKSSTENVSNNQIKTTDVNILLNRVRQDQKKNFKKNLLISIMFAGLACSITIFLII